VFIGCQKQFANIISRKCLLEKAMYASMPSIVVPIT